MYSNKSFSHGGEIPLAMSREFSTNKRAAESFGALSSLQKQQFIDSSFSLYASMNMKAYVDSCGTDSIDISGFDDDLIC